MDMRPTALLGLLAAPLAAQVLLNPPKETRATFSVDVELVNVVCSVRDRHGAYVRDLRKEDFEIREDGQAREIAYFSRGVDVPLTVALLLDVSGSVQNILDTEKVAGSRFFKEVLRPQDKALLVGFAQLIAVWQDLTPSVDTLLAALDKAGPFSNWDPTRETRPRGGTLLYDAIDLVSRHKLIHQSGRKAMILITDGYDNGSLTKLADALRRTQESDSVLYAIHYEDSLAAPATGPSGESVLSRLAVPTGGRTFHITRNLPLEKAFDDIREEMRSQYSLAFKPARDERDGSWRKLEVKSKAGLKVSARDGYYAIRR
jgi:VWFA-related protein